MKESSPCFQAITACLLTCLLCVGIVRIAESGSSKSNSENVSVRQSEAFAIPESVPARQEAASPSRERLNAPAIVISGTKNVSDCHLSAAVLQALADILDSRNTIHAGPCHNLPCDKAKEPESSLESELRQLADRMSGILEGFEDQATWTDGIADEWRKAYEALSWIRIDSDRLEDILDIFSTLKDVDPAKAYPLLKARLGRISEQAGQLAELMHDLTGQTDQASSSSPARLESFREALEELKALGIAPDNDKDIQGEQVEGAQ